METEQRTEKQAPCEIIPASQTFRPKYDRKKHGNIDGRKNKIRKKAEIKKRRFTVQLLRTQNYP